MSADPSPTTQTDPEKPSGGGSALPWIVCLVLSAGLFLLLNRTAERPAQPPAERLPNGEPVSDPAPIPPPKKAPEPRFIRAARFTNEYNPKRGINYWWEAPPAAAIADRVDTGPVGNVHRESYAGAQACQECHPDNFRTWSDHPHHKMNALADAKNVAGDFTGSATIRYRGGIGRFFMEDGRHKMALERDGIHWKYRIHRTIGSRFFQYYAGVAEVIEGVEVDRKDERLKADHVLPFGYWLPAKEWVPVVHVLRSVNRDDNEIDPFDAWEVVPYDRSCADCHTTWAFADWTYKNAGTDLFTRFTPRTVDIHLGGILQKSRPDRYPPDKPLESYSFEEMERLLFDEKLHPDLGGRIALGIECENCHHGSAEHAKASTRDRGAALPKFFPVDPTFHSRAGNLNNLTGRTPENVNFICARCHSGTRPTYANGTHTWNSTEFADASAGHCYHPRRAETHGMDFLTCVSCHDPHVPTGPKWKRTPEEDDNSCIRCHRQFDTAPARAAHSHHAAGSEGARCMNCHMPKINEGLEEIVRTHRIQSPVEKALVEANQPNACNMCHVDQSIDWTLKHVREWFPGRHDFDDTRIATVYPDRSAPAAPGWLASEHSGTRLVGASVLARRDARRHLDALLDLLVTDGHLINRQFIQRELRHALGFDLKALGYQFYMPLAQRREVIDSLRPRLRADAPRQPR